MTVLIIKGIRHVQEARSEGVRLAFIRPLLFWQNQASSSLGYTSIAIKPVANIDIEACRCPKLGFFLLADARVPIRR